MTKDPGIYILNISKAKFLFSFFDKVNVNTSFNTSFHFNCPSSSIVTRFQESYDR